MLAWDSWGPLKQLIIIMSRKKARQPLAVVFVDLARAVHMVSHKHLVDVLERRSVDELVRKLISDSYKGC